MTEIERKKRVLDKDWVRSDIELSLELRRDLYKYAIGSATALLAFTVSFAPEQKLAGGQEIVRFIAWPGLAVSIFCGIILHYVWSEFFISFRNLDNKDQQKEGEALRKVLRRIQIALEALLFGGLLFGLGGVAAFASINHLA